MNETIEKDYVRDTISSEKGFWVGDPEYALQTPPDLTGREGLIPYNGGVFLSARASKNGKVMVGKRSLLVVSRNIALIPLELCDPEKIAANAPFGRVHRVPGNATMYSHFGYFEIFLPEKTNPMSFFTGMPCD